MCWNFPDVSRYPQSLVNLGFFTSFPETAWTSFRWAKVNFVICFRDFWGGPCFFPTKNIWQVRMDHHGISGNHTTVFPTQPNIFGDPRWKVWCCQIDLATHDGKYDVAKYIWRPTMESMMLPNTFGDPRWEVWFAKYFYILHVCYF